MEAGAVVVEVKVVVIVVWGIVVEGNGVVDDAVGRTI